MKPKFIQLSIALLALVIFASGCVNYGTNQPNGNPPASGNSVSIQGFAFNPSTLTIKAGTTVTWTNEDSASHTITSAGFFDSGTIASGQTFSKKFDQPGTYDYICSIHTSMKGKIIVEQ